MQVVKFAVNIAVCYLLAYGMAKPFALWVLSGAGEKVQTNIAMFVGMVLFTGLNYLVGIEEDKIELKDGIEFYAENI